MDEVQFVSSEVVRRLERAIDAFAVAWLDGHVLGENPAGIRLERFGGVTAAATPSRPELDFMNRVHGLAFAGARVLEEVLSFYRPLGLRPWVELPPGAEGMAAGLAEAGARPVESVAVLFGPPRSAAAPDCRGPPDRSRGCASIRGAPAGGPRGSRGCACVGCSRNRDHGVAG